MKKLGLIILLATIILSCTTEDIEKSESIERIVFGEIYGQCGGDCRHLYLLTDEGIYEDSNSDTDFGNWENGENNWMV